MIEILPTEATKRHQRELERVVKNFEKALERFSFSVADEVRKAVQRRGTDVDGVDYRDLEILSFGRSGDFTVAALVLPNSVRKLTKEDEWRTAVSVMPKDPTSVWERELRSLGPWPADLLPNWMDKHVRLVARRVSVSEIDTLVRRLIRIPRAVEFLVSWEHVEKGDTFRTMLDKVEKVVFPEGLCVEEDLAWRALRQEFGLGDEKAIPHWRSALSDEGLNPDRVLLERFWEDLMSRGSGGSPIGRKASVVDASAYENFQKFVTNENAVKSGKL